MLTSPSDFANSAETNPHHVVSRPPNNGAVDAAMGGFFAGKPVLILHNTGAKTGKQRLNPLLYANHDKSYVVAGTKGGSPNHPHWFLNVRAHHPEVAVEVGTEKFPAKATIVEDGPYRRWRRSRSSWTQRDPRAPSRRSPGWRP